MGSKNTYHQLKIEKNYVWRQILLSEVIKQKKEKVWMLKFKFESLGLSLRLKMKRECLIKARNTLSLSTPKIGSLFKIIKLLISYQIIPMLDLAALKIKLKPCLSLFQLQLHSLTNKWCITRWNLLTLATQIHYYYYPEFVAFSNKCFICANSLAHDCVATICLSLSSFKM